MRADPRPAVHPDSPNDDGPSGPSGPERGRGGLSAQRTCSSADVGSWDDWAGYLAGERDPEARAIR